MWPFNKKQSLRNVGVLENFTDWHSHILPGVDDGVENMEDAIEILNVFEKGGVKKVWLTPHIMEDYPNETQTLKKKFEQLKREWHGNLKISLASENMLDSLFEKRLENNDFLPIGEDMNHLLVETSYFNPPYGMNDMISGIKKRGYYVILAHPERYRYMDEKDYERLKREGILFQMNLLSLSGAYGKLAQKKAQWLLKKSYINFLGTDLHRLMNFQNLLDFAHLDRKEVKALTAIKSFTTE